MSTIVHEDLTENEKLDEVVENTEPSEPNEVEILKAKIKELEDENLRTHAEFQNIKKRLEKEKLNAIKHSHEKFSLDLLEVLDTLYLAETAIKDEKEKEGISNTIKKLEDVFKKYNITETLYDIFDPNEHQAIQTAETDKDSGKIVQVHRRGYKIHDKILRPAMVSVSE
jgi:molecular chaperone GrpE